MAESRSFDNAFARSTRMLGKFAIGGIAPALALAMGPVGCAAESDTHLVGSRAVEALAAARVPEAVPPVPAELAELGEPADRTGVTYGFSVSNGRIEGAFEDSTPPKVSSVGPLEPKPGVTVENNRLPKLSPRLERDLQTMSAAQGKDMANVVVTFVQDISLPRFPAPRYEEDRMSAANQAILSRRAVLADTAARIRQPGYAAIERELAANHGAKMGERFWIMKAAVVDVSMDQIRALSSREDVQYVEYTQSDDPPPHVGENISDARALLGTEPYAVYSANWIGMLDTGVRSTHTLFNTPNRLSWVRDCVQGTSNNCGTGTNLNPADTCWDHGTRTAGIMVGNNNLGAALRGVTGIALDSYKVYPDGWNGMGVCNSGHNVQAVVRAFQATTAGGDHTVLANVQAGEPYHGAISTAADLAFDAGHVVVASNGNGGPAAGTVGAPANAHKVLGIGARTMINGTLRTDSARGPAADNRFKPDLIAPADVHSISNASDSAIAPNLFIRTSSAAPFAAATAAVVGNWWRQAFGLNAPGYVYAHMIALGSNAGSLNNDTGAGLISIPASSTIRGGKVFLAGNQNIDTTISLTSPGAIVAALWWPQGTVSNHNDVDLEVYRPNGTLAGTSAWGQSVIEQTFVWAGGVSGNWKIRVKGYSVSGFQDVYWAALIQQ